MKPRTVSKSNSRTRGSLTPSRSRSISPAASRRAKTKPMASKPRSRAKASGSRAASAAAKGGRTSSRGSGSAKTTTDHEEIRQWVESQGGHPATVKRTTRDRQAAGILRIDFPGFSGEQSLKPISWEE